MTHPYGRFTVRGSSVVEDLITVLVDEAVNATRATLQLREYRALVMIGGYGRGEGGVEIVEDKERPHNNLDFLLIAESPSLEKQRDLRTRLLLAFEPIMRKYDIEIDLSVTSVWKLRLSPSLIIWYDMRHGHKTILGDAQYVPSLEHFCLEHIPARDALRLLVNRGTLLIINERLLKEDKGDTLHRKRIVRNIAKAIIGYGDALLFFLDAYDWSYVERKRRMQLRQDVSPAFRALYDEAAEFRFRPDYARYLSRDLKTWMNDLRPILESIHLSCEKKRLHAPGMTWQEYPARVLNHALIDEPFSGRGWARKALNLARRVPTPAGLGVGAKLGCRVLGIRNLYPLAFPAVAYHFRQPHLQRFTAALLNVNSTDENALRERYLHVWSTEGDINAWSSLRKWQIPVMQEKQG